MVSHGASPYMTHTDTSRCAVILPDTYRRTKTIAHLTPPVLTSLTQQDTVRCTATQGEIVKLLKQGPKKEWGCLPRVAVAAAVVLLATWLVVS
jgi:hypothetical protein